ncbi:MAG: hypothetical protein IAC06_00870 [Bacteroidetes bacterium]|uniref:Cytochrome c domain-containing protein n=1 Tax=Candidatus Cryptobacteroides intestinavium TaxID=2840766 RepID=A0A9D9EP19_9BACT|nr:hypothetical protein [Candidatus Cryptobacteroides intestinavium]
MKNLSVNALLPILLAVAACAEKNGTVPETPEDTSWIAVETYAGGELGTTFNRSASAFEDPAPAVEQAGMEYDFKQGEYFFERTFTQNTEPFDGLGPLYLRASCLDCHPGYGHGKRMERYRWNDYGNGYLLVLYDPSDNSYLTSLTGMPQTQAVAPFKAPLDETKISIEWKEYTDEWGNEFPDGEKYSLIYPEVTIPADAYYVPILSKNGELDASEVGIRLESTIGIYGSGLIDAIPDDSLLVQYQKEEAMGLPLNPAIYAGGQWQSQYSNTRQGDGEKHPFRYTYALSRGAVQDGPGANAIWNITNVTRSDRRYHYMTAAYATKASQDPEVQAEFYNYFPEYRTDAGVEKDIYNYLMGEYKDEDGNTVAVVDAEMNDEDYVDFMVWHRGLAVPAARDLDDPVVQRGRKLFREIGCATCHRPSWKTGADELNDPNNFFSHGDSRLPKYPYQTIWPYSDFVQHQLKMVNDIRGGWCRTTPLWGRGLSQICSGHQDRLHDCRARNVIEAIMWHGGSGSDARKSTEAFRELTADDRNAIVAFINAI